MNIKRNKIQSLFKPVFIFIGVSGLLLLSYGTVVAVRSDISANDGVVTDWAGIDVFLTDPVGDVPTADEDIIDAWVETSSVSTAEALYFLVQVNASPALSASERGTVAYLDCEDPDGNPPNGIMEAWDRLIIYGENLPTYGNTMLLCFGDQSTCGWDNYFPDYGQIVGDYIEWGILLADLPPADGQHTSDCAAGHVDINLTTAIITSSSQTEIDVTDAGPRGFNVPTVVTMKEMKANSSGWNTDFAYLFLGGVLVLTGFGGLAIYTKKKNSQ